MTKKTVLILAVCLLLIIAAITGCDTEHEPTNPYPDTTPSITPNTTPSTSLETHPTDPNATYIDLSLYGTWISPDNEVIQSDAVSITVDGTIARNEYDQNIVECQIAFSSDTFEHTCGSATNIADDFETAPYFVCPYQPYYSTTQSQVIPYFALSLEHGYAIFAKADDLGNYLIASKDPETDSQEILDYFQDFIAVYASATPSETQPTDPITTYIDWTMYGTQFTLDGEIAETLEFTLRIIDIDSSEKVDYLSLGFTFPDTYRYFLDYDTPYVSYSYLPYFNCNCFAFDQQEGMPSPAAFALSVDKGIMVIYWRNSDLCLAASTDPSTDPQEILDYFQDFIEVYTPSSSEDAS